MFKNTIAKVIDLQRLSHESEARFFLRLLKTLESIERTVLVMYGWEEVLDIFYRKRLNNNDNAQIRIKQPRVVKHEIKDFDISIQTEITLGGHQIPVITSGYLCAPQELSRNENDDWKTLEPEVRLSYPIGLGYEDIAELIDDPELAFIAIPDKFKVYAVHGRKHHHYLHVSVAGKSEKRLVVFRGGLLDAHTTAAEVIVDSEGYYWRIDEVVEVC